MFKTLFVSRQALCFLGLSLLAPLAFAQEATIRGLVTDESNGQPLIGANVALMDSVQIVRGGVTNEEGFFNIPRIRPGQYVLRITYVGYATYRDTLQLNAGAIIQQNVVLAPSSEEIDEIVVESDRDAGAGRLDGGLQRIRPSDIQRIPTPGPSGDLAGYLQALPSVVSMGDRGGQLFVRGGTPSQNLILMDGTLIYKPFHIIGFFSAFPDDLVSNVDLYAGGFGARYSGRISSVIDVTMRGGNNQRFQGAASISPFLSGVRIEGPIKKGQVSMLGSFRTSLIEQTAPQLLGEPLPMMFNDWFVKVQHTGDNSRCSSSVMHTYDRGRIDVERDEVFRWTNTVIAGQCAGFTPNSKVYSNVNTGLTYVGNAVGSATSPERTANTWRINVDANFTFFSGSTEYSWGVFGRTDNLKYFLAEQFHGLKNDEEFLLEVGGYVGAKLALHERLDLNPSLALSLPFDHKPGLEPRLRLKWRPWNTQAQELNVAIGLYQQTFMGVSDERDAGSVFTAWLAAPLEGKQARAFHALLGWFQQIGPLDFSAEGYYKRLNNLPVPIWSTLGRFTTALMPADANIYGLDMRLAVQHRTVYAYVGYGYSWTRYQAAQENFGLWFGEPIQEYHPPHDRRHQFNAVASWSPGAFQTSIRWQYSSGFPYTKPLGFDSLINVRGLAEDPAGDYGTPRFLFDKPYDARLPTYHRLDVSAGYTFTTRLAALTLQAGAINLYDRVNLFYYDVFALRRVNQLPFTPYISLKLETR